MSLREMCQIGKLLMRFRAAAQRRRIRPLRDGVELARVGKRLKAIVETRPLTAEKIVEAIELGWAYLSGKDV